MSKQALDEFRDQLAVDEDLREALRASATSADDPDGLRVGPLVAFAKARGFDVTAEDVHAEGELSEEELEHASGGAAYMKFRGVKGETTDADHKEWINVLSFGQFVPRQ